MHFEQKQCSGSYIR